MKFKVGDICTFRELPGRAIFEPIEGRELKKGLHYEKFSGEFINRAWFFKGAEIWAGGGVMFKIKNTQQKVKIIQLPLKESDLDKALEKMYNKSQS